MVFVSMRQTNEVIDSNYYDRELKYQQVIDAKKNLQKTNDSVLLVTGAHHIKVIFPKNTVSQLDSGKIEFLKLSDSKFDHVIVMKPSNDSLYEVPLALLAKGMYRVRIEWSNDRTGYYQEKDLQIE